ncbi:radical SAM protein, partial [Candidatus Omnitrophota bacterium]
MGDIDRKIYENDLSEVVKLLSSKGDPDDILIEELGDNFREYRRRWKSINTSTETEHPIHLDFELNFGCNLKCEICILQTPPEETKFKKEYGKVLSYEKFCEIIDDGIEKGLCSITLSGNNEPLLFKEIPQYIEYAKKKNVLDIIMLTNGTLLDTVTSEELVNSGLTRICFSVGGGNMGMT